MRTNSIRETGRETEYETGYKIERGKRPSAFPSLSFSLRDIVMVMVKVMVMVMVMV